MSILKVNLVQIQCYHSLSLSKKHLKNGLRLKEISNFKLLWNLNEIEYFLHKMLDVFTLTFQKGRTGIKYVNTELIKRKHSKENSKS